MRLRQYILLIALFSFFKVSCSQTNIWINTSLTNASFIGDSNPLGVSLGLGVGLNLEKKFEKNALVYGLELKSINRKTNSVIFSGSWNAYIPVVFKYKFLEYKNESIVLLGGLRNIIQPEGVLAIDDYYKSIRKGGVFPLVYLGLGYDFSVQHKKNEGYYSVQFGTNIGFLPLETVKITDLSTNTVTTYHTNGSFVEISLFWKLKKKFSRPPREDKSSDSF